MARKRTQKSVSARIDRTYIDRLHRWRRFRLSMVFLFSAICVLLIASLATMGSRGELIQNPGRLTFVHAKFQNDCAACHDGCDSQGHPTGKFTKTVSDGACLKCHDAGIHHANQATMVTIDNRRNPPETRSADCTVCHVEHRGQQALVSTADALCINCHADLKGKTIKTPAAEVPLQVTAFTEEGHPHFGRMLMAGKKLTDPTDLRFNHKKHLQGLIDDKHKEMRECTFCHDPNPSAALTLHWETGKSAFSMPDGSKVEDPMPLIDGSGRHDSMTQVNYAKDCEVCHSLGTFPGSDVPVPHENMGLIRRAILAYVTDTAEPWQKYAKDASGPKEKLLNDRFASKISGNVPGDFPGAGDQMDAVTKAVKTDPLSPEFASAVSAMPPDMLPALLKAAAKVKTNVIPAASKAGFAAAVSASTRPSDHIRPLALTNLREEFLKTDEVKALSADAKKKMLAQFDSAFSRFNQDAPDPRLVQIYVMYANDSGYSCIKCHDVQGDAAAVPTEWASLQSPIKAAPPDDSKPSFATKPTLIPAGPRRWYTNSVFNHDAHRSMNCVECHSAALNSTETADVLSPDITWQGLRFKPGSTTEMEPATRSCIECHHPDNSEGPGAASNCTECHVYHDRSHESAPKPTPDDVLTGKTKAEAKQVSMASP